MPSLNDLKTLLLRRFMLVLAVTVLGTTALIQTPRVWHLRTLAVEADCALRIGGVGAFGCGPPRVRPRCG